MRVLIADDDPVSLLVLDAAVRRLGHECALASDGLEAWRMVVASQPDVLITDWQMPLMDGTQLVGRVREACVTAYTYVMVLSAEVGGEAARASMSAGADDLLRKPLRAAELDRKLIAAQRLVGLHQHLRNDARVDPLTGIGNRLRLNEDLQALHARATRHGQHYAVAIADIDRFKSLNDISGHLAGDEILRDVAGALLATMRRGDGIYRYGGEEFVALFPEQALQGAALAAGRLQGAVTGRALAHPAGGMLSVSVGVAARGDAESDPEAVLARADRALYVAKARGGSRTASAAEPIVAAVRPHLSPAASSGVSWSWHPRERPVLELLPGATGEGER